MIPNSNVGLTDMNRVLEAVMNFFNIAKPEDQLT